MPHDTEHPPDERIPELAYTWRELSELVQQARTGAAPASVNDSLQHQLDSDRDGPLAAPMLLWMADNLMLEKRFEEAAEVLAQLVEAFPERGFGEGSWASLALERMADCYERLDRPDEAIAALQRLIDGHSKGRSVPYMQFRAAEIAEAAGKLDDAAALYKQASAGSDDLRETQVSITDLARRNAERLASARRWMRPDPQILARDLTRALAARDGRLLARLASPTHFTLGVLHGDRIFVDQKKLLAIITADLGRSKLRVDPLALGGSGDKRYLATEGWRGSFLVEQVVFILSRATGGWEWSGIALTRFPEVAWEDVLGPQTRVTNQPLALSIKSPWPAGFSLRAGGIIPFGAQVLACMGAGPFAPLCFIAMAGASPCGFGPGGLFYGGVAGFNFTHGGDDFFAIDFARFVRGVPFANATLGTPVLNVQQGMVSGVRGNIARGSTATDNRVLVKHMTQGEWVMLVILEWLSGVPLRQMATPRFTSLYLHLDGPFRIPVSPGMFARQGASLGLMDDTGLSMDHHLHFSIHDRTLPASFSETILNPAGRSVRPTPMDGQRLLEADDGACLGSTNA